VLLATRADILALADALEPHDGGCRPLRRMTTSSVPRNGAVDPLRRCARRGRVGGARSSRRRWGLGSGTQTRRRARGARRSRRRGTRPRGVNAASGADRCHGRREGRRTPQASVHSFPGAANDRSCAASGRPAWSTCEAGRPGGPQIAPVSSWGIR
jgi:hypothetical protein